MLQFDQVTLRRGSRVLFEGASLQIHPGQRVGITGANGSGKSSLFALLLGELQCDSGRVSVPPDWTCAHVAQQAAAGSGSALDFTLDGDVALRAVQRDLALAETRKDGRRQAELLAQLETIDGYTASSRAARLLSGLGFAAADQQRPVNSFSGGWRVRLNLARALMCPSDLLLLDEPTNHLDLDAVLWLERWLQNYPGTLLLVSHDRDFLDAVIDHVLNIEHETALLYTGNYTAFEQVRAARLAAEQAKLRKQQRQVAHMRAFVDRFRAKATKARQAQSRLKALARMEQIIPAHVDSPFEFSLREPEALPAPLLTLDNVAAGYGTTTVLSGVSATLRPGDRIGLLGPNGAGKSTLIKLLANELEASSGRQTPAKQLRIGYFAQHQVEQLELDDTPLAHLARLAPAAREQDLRTFLGTFGFVGDQALAPVGPFSGGEKSRLALALLVYRRPNLLLLDEPTNHLDLEMRQALALALQPFNGAMVIVSHDRHLLRLTVDQLWLVCDGKVGEFDGALDDYPAWLQQRRRAQDSGDRDDDVPDTGAGGNSSEERKQRKRREAEQRQQAAPLRREVADAEREVEKLGAEQQRLDALLADSELYASGNDARLRDVLEQQRTNKAQLARAEERWLQCCERLETLQAGFGDEHA